jgi:hypothetical protein
VLGWTVRTPHTLYRVRTWADSLIVEGAAAELLRIETATPTDEWPAARPLQARSA